MGDWIPSSYIHIQQAKRAIRYRGVAALLLPTIGNFYNRNNGNGGQGRGRLKILHVLAHQMQCSKQEENYCIRDIWPKWQIRCFLNIDPHG